MANKKPPHKSDSEIRADTDKRSRAAARERARELERAGHTKLARAFIAYAEGRTDGRSLTLSEYLDPPDVEGANAARARDSAADVGNSPGFREPAPNEPGSHHVPRERASAHPLADDYPGGDDEHDDDADADDFP